MSEVNPKSEVIVKSEVIANSTEVVLENDDETAVDVFTHSKTAFPGAWSEEEVSELLATWREVVERTRPSARRFNVAQRILRRYRAKGNTDVTIDVIRKHIKTLRTEYRVFQGLCKIGKRAHRAPCVDQLELILDKIPARRREEAPLPPKGPPRRDRRPRAYSENDTVRSEEDTDAKPNGESDQEANPKVARYQRINLPRLLRAMMEQQNSVLERLERLFSAFEISNKRMLGLVDALVALQSPRRPHTPDIPLIVVTDEDN